MSIKLATKIARNSTFDRARIGAVLIKGGRVLATAHNELRYVKSNRRNWPSVHAEEAAILKVIKNTDGLKQLAGATIYISRILKSGETACAKPCFDCQSLIESVGIRKVIHT